jgi:hypothetical protein
MAVDVSEPPELTGAEQENPTRGARVAGGKFAPGKSGNPAGRPKGARGKATLLAQELLGGEADVRRVVKRAIEDAAKGKPTALKLVIERLVPRPREAAVAIDLPAVEKAEDVADACAAVIAAAADGEISIAEAREWMELLEARRRSIETCDLAVRIRLLEDAPDIKVGFQ